MGLGLEVLLKHHQTSEQQSVILRLPQLRAGLSSLHAALPQGTPGWNSAPGWEPMEFLTFTHPTQHSGPVKLLLAFSQLLSSFKLAPLPSLQPTQMD